MRQGRSGGYRIFAEAASSVEGIGGGSPNTIAGGDVRVLADKITIAITIAVAMFIFMISIPLLPAQNLGEKQSSPILVALVSAGIGVLVYFGRIGIAAGISWLIVVASVLWHLFNIGILALLDPRLASRYTALSISTLILVGCL